MIHDNDPNLLSQLSEETKAVLYYSLVCLKNDIERNLHWMKQNGQLNSDVTTFHNNILKEVSARLFFLTRQQPLEGFSLIKHFSA